MGKKTSFYQIRNMPKRLSKAVKVAAALDGIPIWQWVVRVLEGAVKDAGVIYMKEEDNDNAKP